MYFDFDNITRVLGALLTPIIAIIATYIAWQQWKTSYQKLNLDRYDRRLRIYEEVTKILVVIVREADASYEELARFRVSVAEADFLFGPDIAEYVDEIYERGVRLHGWNEQYRDGAQIKPAGYDHQKVVDEMHKELNWLLKQLETVIVKFNKYMSVSR